ncbi:MAG: hypothetical protein WB116_12150 [Candidatus Dormiibacterota bacterium]
MNVGTATQAGSLPVNDPRRLPIRRAVFGTVLASATFFAFTATKFIPPIYDHAPWYNDPYDTVLSFTMFFVPLVVACLLVQVSLCLRSEPLPTARVVAILRGSRVALGAIAAEVISAWVALVLGANRSHWTSGVTGLLIVLLALCTLATVSAIADLLRTPELPQTEPAAPASDWLADLVLVAVRESRRLGPLYGPMRAALLWVDGNVGREVRRHPLISAAIASALFGVTVFTWQGIREGYGASVTLMAVGLGTCGMFAFLLSAGSYIGLVRAPSRLSGARRRAVDSSVAACALVIAVLALRNYLWWVVGSTPAAGKLPQLALLFGCAALISFAITFTVETLLRSHSNLQTQSPTANR